ncbi:multivesicular body subunit 12B-like isoform X2 [Mizuhopecten yessoensis]|uniref:multivesicular body subunit 12B-like isoform X2 n=1 Tax=Mizuhopecten yessoensis TaxID=6573 RepID=UPI000B458981|nr:multivesicular body subunit 12B-like isoform X2 [Mizuhopecten yessoensis]
MSNSDWPITAVTVVTDPSKCPAGYTIIDKTYDKRDDADLWRDGYFGKRICRYMCVERSAPSVGKDVLVDVAIINERDPIPAGFTCIDFTSDSREKAMKKKMLCVRYMSCTLTNDAIAELIIMSKGVRRPPNGYNLVGELNNMALCFKMATFRSPTAETQQNNVAQSYMPTTPTYTTESPLNHMAGVGTALPYAINPTTNHARPGLDRTNSIAGIGSNHPLSGVPWQINSRYTDIARLQDIMIPQIGYKSIMDIENEYSYTFNIERSVSANSFQ